MLAASTVQSEKSKADRDSGIRAQARFSFLAAFSAAASLLSFEYRLKCHASRAQDLIAEYVQRVSNEEKISEDAGARDHTGKLPGQPDGRKRLNLGQSSAITDG